MHRVVIPLVALAVIVLAFDGAARDVRHLRLVKSTPAADATIDESPAMVRLWFNQVPELRVSAIGVTPESGERHALDVEGTDDSLSIAARIPSPLAPGGYTVSWRTAGDDGHILRGEFEFTLRSAR